MPALNEHARGRGGGGAHLPPGGLRRSSAGTEDKGRGGAAVGSVGVALPHRAEGSGRTRGRDAGTGSAPLPSGGRRQGALSPDTWRRRPAMSSQPETVTHLPLASRT